MPEIIPLLPRLLLTAATLAYGTGPFIIDMNRTHLLHPAWPGHARFHLLWSSAAQFAVSCLALYLIWSHGPHPLLRCQLAAVIGFCMASGFWVALVLRRFYQGTLHDPGGIRPWLGKIDANVIAMILITGLLYAAWRILPVA